ncbi:hypothetical protein [Micromonospora narathiwatensis]|uniref:Uncharacterized protein n=1 Tax=Micromonospora narathiwatensis TaxID=299146 RepID=A0A1A8ZPZ3_9ACTN|nr:hypothetical protein [Micromonospora narathiwatensis]SBT45897.1 hypothetical protein GA0070621_2464 [Micromonospora narathiwatensis]
MTDEHLDRLVRDADPYRPDVVRHLDGARHALLEEIMSVPPVHCLLEPPQPRPRGMVRRTAGALAAAAVLTGVLAVPAVLPDHQDDRPAAPAGTPVVYSAAALKAAEDNPRLLINRPGWKVETVYGFAKQQGTIRFRNGRQELEMNWYPAGDYDGFRADRLTVGKPEPVTIDSWPGDRFTYNAGDFAVLLRPRDGVFVELRTGGYWPRDMLDRVLTDVVRVDARTWLAALPAEVITPDRVAVEAAKVLADIPLPPRFDAAALGDIGANDPYHFGAEVTGRVGCAWIAEWLRARRTGDDAALQRATEALRGSHQWRVLHQMNEKGDWPEVFWEIADGFVAGSPKATYAQGLGCA